MKKPLLNKRSVEKSLLDKVNEIKKQNWKSITLSYLEGAMSQIFSRENPDHTSDFHNPLILALKKLIGENYVSSKSCIFKGSSRN